uniref:Uncharacterized protein n=1 Tax=Chaetoceros debilis TaxID=122233 RepID=A0A7S3PU37_9STRA
MKLLKSSLLLVALLETSHAFVNPSLASRSRNAPVTSLQASDRLEPGDAVLLIGPGFLQLNVAKAAKAAGLNPIIVAPQDKINSFVQYVNDDDLINDAIIGIPDPGEPYYGEIGGVVYCAEGAILPDSIVGTVLDWKDRDVFSKDGIKRAVGCIPISGKINKEKSMGWVPVFNNDRKEKEVWTKFTTAFKSHPVMKEGGGGTTIRFGSLLGGSVDGCDELQALGLDERVYKMSMENYRDLKERSFDRYRIGAQVLTGDVINVKPPNQEKMEKEAINKGEYLEAFRAAGGYPEIDRTNRHTAAQAVIQALMRPESEVPKEFSILSKCVSSVPTTDEWDAMFESPGPATWPDPFSFEPTDYGFEAETAN